MKPEKLLISAHLDHEVESPWKERIESLIASDREWQLEAAQQQWVKTQLAQAPEADPEASRQRVWQAIQERVGQKPVARLSWRPWGLSAAAAALVLVALSAGYWWGRQSSGSGPMEMAELQVELPQQVDLQLQGEGQLLRVSTLERSQP